MKKRFTTLLLNFAAVAVFAQDAVTVTAPPSNVVHLDVKPALPKIEEKAVVPSSSFGYFRMGVSDSQVPTNGYYQSLPGLGVGYRFTEGAYAIDISASFNRRRLHTEDGNVRTYSYSLPKANYLYYLSPTQNTSLYAGAGLAWGGVRTKDAREFHGIIPDVVLGIEFKRTQTLRTFGELVVSQPFVAASQKGELPGPHAELSVGAGF